MKEQMDKLIEIVADLEEINRGDQRSRELSVALTHIQTGVMWLGAALGAELEKESE